MTDVIMASTTARKTMEEICSVAGTKLPPVPAIPPDSVPNLDPIGKVYELNFALGLDKLLESERRWFTNEGFGLVAQDRTMLGLVLAYLTLISNNADKPLSEDATLASQEARVTWGSLSLCARLEHDAGKDAERLARRFKILESILTGEPLTAPPASMSEFVHQDEIEEHNDPTPTSKDEASKSTTFERQVSRRRDDFWKQLEYVAVSQGRGDDGVVDIVEAMAQVKSLTDGKENRDIIYATLQLGWGRNGDPSSERELAKRFLQSEAQGRATELVFATVAGMGLRAFGEG
jgi:hypothetical protein